MKRKIITLIMLIAIIGTLLAVFVGCSGDRSKTLRIANWGEYMSKETYEGFVEWYKEKTGEDVVIDYDEFDTNENLYTWVARKHDDYDLICPSDYMIQRMKSEGLLLKLSDETLEVLNKAMNELHDRNGFDNKFFVFVAIVMEGDIFAIVIIDA